MASAPQPLKHSELEVVQPVFGGGKLAQPYHSPVPGRQAGENLEEKRTICGVRSTTFILLLALLFVIVAAGVGGGVGGSLAVNNAKKYVVYIFKVHYFVILYRL